MPRPRALLLLALAALAACVSQTRESFTPAIDPTAEIEQPPLPKPRPPPERVVRPPPAPEPAAAECEHDWEQIGTHSYRVLVNGIPMPEMCAISRCPKCGFVRHECASRR